MTAIFVSADGPQRIHKIIELIQVCDDYEVGFSFTWVGITKNDSCENLVRNERLADDSLSSIIRSKSEGGMLREYKN